MEQKILLVDLVGDVSGHYFIMQTLSKIKNTIEIDTQEKKYHIKENPILGYIERWKMYKRVQKCLKQYEDKEIVMHLITGDKFYILPLFKSLERKNRKVLVTIHRFPTRKLQQLLLKNFSKRVSSFIVFSDYLKTEFENIGIHNVMVVPYPTFYNYSLVPCKDTLKKLYGVQDKIVISALGGTRYEKGLDLLISSFQYLSDSIKQRIILNIAGREEDFKRDYIEQLLKKYNVKALLTLKSLSDVEFCENVKMTDIMAIPYRKSFNSGASGPMTEAMSQGIPSLFPKCGSLECYEQKYRVGCTFECENLRSLAETILYMIENDIQIDYSVSSIFTNEGFIKNHEHIYQEQFKSISAYESIII